VAHKSGKEERTGLGTSRKIFVSGTKIGKRREKEKRKYMVNPMPVLC